MIEGPPGLPSGSGTSRSRAMVTNPKEKAKEDNPPKIRKEFPETWLWADEKLE